MDLVKHVIGAGIDASARIEDAKLKLELDVGLLVVAGPLLDKIAALIPGHFEDALIEEAKKKLADLAAVK